MLNQVETPLGPESRASQRRGSSPAGNPTPEMFSGAAPVPPKAAVNRPQQLLELAGKVARSTWGGIALLAEGELVEHLTFGISDENATELARSAWFVPFISFLYNRPAPATLKDLAESGLMLAMSRSEDPSERETTSGCRLPAMA